MKSYFGKNQIETRKSEFSGISNLSRENLASCLPLENKPSMLLVVFLGLDGGIIYTLLQPGRARRRWPRFANCTGGPSSTLIQLLFATCCLKASDRDSRIFARIACPNTSVAILFRDDVSRLCSAVSLVSATTKLPGTAATYLGCSTTTSLLAKFTPLSRPAIGRKFAKA